MKKPAALTISVASPCSDSAPWTSATADRSVNSAAIPQALPRRLVSSATVSSTRSFERPMITALPPRSMTSSAAWRPMPVLPPTTTIFLPSNSVPIDESPFLDLFTCYAAFSVWLGGAEAIGDAAQVCRKSSLAGLGVSCLHPAAPITRVRVDRGGERGIAQLSPSGAVQLRVTKRAYWAGTSQNDSADPRGICVAGY